MKPRDVVLAAIAGNGNAAQRISNWLRFSLGMNNAQSFDYFKRVKPDLTEPEFDEVMQLADAECSQ